MSKQSQNPEDQGPKRNPEYDGPIAFEEMGDDLPLPRQQAAQDIVDSYQRTWRNADGIGLGPDPLSGIGG